jgi:hypothetical protein
MKRKFRVDASKKIQAGPVDFSLFDIPQGNNPEEIEQILEDNRDALETYFETKAIETANSINSDLRTILDKYVGSDNFEYFIDNCLVPAGVSEDQATKSQVFDTIYYDTIGDSDYIMLELNPGLPDADLAYFTFSLFMDDTYDAMWNTLSVTFADPVDFVDELISTFTSDEFVNKITPENVVDMCEQLIYDYCTFADAKFSTIFEKATTEYLNK